MSTLTALETCIDLQQPSAGLSLELRIRLHGTEKGGDIRDLPLSRRRTRLLEQATDERFLLEGVASQRAAAGFPWESVGPE